jgi:Fic family protein
MLPNPELFVGMYIRKEAVLSSQIEGTQASLVDVLEYEASTASRKLSADVAELVNYISAMNYGLQRLDELPLSNRLLREIHKELLRGTRGEQMTPGEFRTSQNWIGPEGCDLSGAVFVPPPPHEMERAIGELETFIHSDMPMPTLIKIGLIHSQFETIHPFLDGNGRMGRLLITFFLCQQGVLKRPLLYLSSFFKQNRDEYYARLQAVRDNGDWEQWLLFFVTAVWHVSREASDTAHQIFLMREGHRHMIQEGLTRSVIGLELLDHLYQTPYLTVDRAKELLNVSYPTANALISGLSDLGLLREITGQQRNRLFEYTQYIDLLRKGTEVPTSAPA